MSSPKAKVYAVTILGRSLLVYGLTRASAINNAIESLDTEIDARIATGEEMYAAGKAGAEFIGESKYKRVSDPSQSDLPIPEVDDTDSAGA